MPERYRKATLYLKRTECTAYCPVFLPLPIILVLVVVWQEGTTPLLAFSENARLPFRSLNHSVLIRGFENDEVSLLPNKKIEADFKITLWTEVQSYKCMASMVGRDKTLVITWPMM